MLHALLPALLLTGGAPRADPAPQRVGVILSQLPAAGSEAYAALRRQAGPAPGRRLPLSKAEMWSVPQRYLAALQRAASAHGAGIAVLGADWNEVFRPLPSGQQLTPEQQAMVRRARAASGTLGVTIVAPPPPALVEYALTQEVTSAGGGKIVAALGAQVRLTLSRSSFEVRPDMCVWRGAVDGSDMPAMLMWWPAGKLAGVIHDRGRIYSIRHIGAGVHVVIETSEDVLPQDHAPAHPPAAGPRPEEQH